jgi:integrase
VGPRGRDYARPRVSRDQQGREGLGRRDDSQGDLGARQNGRRAAGIEKLAPHDLRRSCARLCHLAGGELDQIQFLLGHVSIQTTERYLGCKQKLRVAVNDTLGIEPERVA